MKDAVDAPEPFPGLPDDGGHRLRVGDIRLEIGNLRAACLKVFDGIDRAPDAVVARKDTLPKRPPGAVGQLRATDKREARVEFVRQRTGKGKRQVC